MHFAIYSVLLSWVGYTKSLGAIQVNKYKSGKKINIKIYFCGFNFEEYFKLTMYVAIRDSIKKNNKLSKVDWGITIISTKNNIFLEKRILKKNQPFNYFLFSN